LPTRGNPPPEPMLIQPWRGVVRSRTSSDSVLTRRPSAVRKGDSDLTTDGTVALVRRHFGSCESVTLTGNARPYPAYIGPCVPHAVGPCQMPAGGPLSPAGILRGRSPVEWPSSAGDPRRRGIAEAGHPPRSVAEGNLHHHDEDQAERRDERQHDASVDPHRSTPIIHTITRSELAPRGGPDTSPRGALGLRPARPQAQRAGTPTEILAAASRTTASSNATPGSRPRSDVVIISYTMCAGCRCMSDSTCRMRSTTTMSSCW
jgi:hypothetical protein